MQDKVSNDSEINLPNHDNPSDHNHPSDHISHSHSHGMFHSHGSDSSENSLRNSIIITFLFFIAEIIGGYLSGSLTLLGDAFHMLRDLVSLFISLAALKVAQRVSTKEKTFGYHRVEIFAAFINGVVLIFISFWMGFEAYERIISPTDVNANTMLIIGLIGLGANVYAALSLRGQENLNIKSAFLHVLTDTISSVVVVIGAIVISTTGNYLIDPILSMLIATFIFFSTLNVIKESVMILLEFTPPGIDLDEIIERLEDLKNVSEIHDFHLWSLSSNFNVATLHVLSTEPDIKKQL